MFMPHDSHALITSSSSTSHGVTEFLSSPAWLATMVGVKSMVQQHYQHKRGSGKSDSFDIVDSVICICSVAGTMSIIIPYFASKGSRKLRHSLILGLATSDLASSLIIASTSIYSLAGGHLSEATRFCTFAGYSFAVAIWTQHLWNLSIAIITYMILVHPLSTFVSSVERHLMWLWPAFWAVSLLVNGIAWIFVGFGNVGGYCSFNPTKGGLYFSATFQFIPRALVVLVVIVLYTHLFFFLRRVNMFNRANTSRGRSGLAPDDSFHQPFNQDGNQEQLNSTSNAADRLQFATLNEKDRRWSMSTKFDLWNKWKGSLSESSALPSPPAKEEGSRNGSSSSQGKSSEKESTNPNKPDLTGIEMVDYSEVSPKSTLPSDHLLPTTTRSTGHLTTTVPIIRAPPQSPRVNTAKLHASQRPGGGDRSPHSSNTIQSKIDAADKEEDTYVDDDLSPYQLMQPRRDVRDFGMTSPPQEHLRHYSLSPTGMNILKRAQSDVEAGEEGRSRDGAAANSEGDTSIPDEPTYENMLGQDWTWGMPVGGASKEMTSPTQQQSKGIQLAPPTPSRKQSKNKIGVWLNPISNDRGTGTGSGSGTSQTDENGVETLGTTLNRQASILLLLYPAVYCLLFSVSIIRIIVDLSAPPANAAEKARRNMDALHSISRWTIFAQGAIDAFIFQLVERSFRKRLKRRRRIAAGEVVEETWWTKGTKMLSRWWARK